jgi:gliding motility-associated-like protein
MIDGLAAGSYTIELTDGEGCKTEVEIQIKSASSETLSLGEDQTILVGDSVVIDPQLSFSADTFYWTGDVDQLLIPDQLHQVIFPEEDQVYQLFGIDEKGCLYSDELKIRVLLTSVIIVPNVFSPNGDGINDVLAISSDPSITEVEYFQIYSRWGELVYEERNFIPGQANSGWDGKMRGEEVQSGVYVYKAKAMNKRGQEILVFGDMTLIR